MLLEMEGALLSLLQPEAAALFTLFLAEKKPKPIYTRKDGTGIVFSKIKSKTSPLIFSNIQLCTPSFFLSDYHGGTE